MAKIHANMWTGSYCILVIFLNSICITASESVCNKITISQTTSQKHLEGTYVLSAEQGCGGKPSWRQEGGHNYIYKHNDYTRDTKGQWFVGPNYCSASAGIKAPPEDSQTPLDIGRNVWQEVDVARNQWVGSGKSMTCTDRQGCNPGRDQNCPYVCGQCSTRCHSVTGACNCLRWWVGDTCKSLIESLPMTETDIEVDQVTGSTAVVHWQPIDNVPTGLHTYFKYQVQMKKEKSSDDSWWKKATTFLWEWEDGPFIDHNPGSTTMQDEVGGLKGYREYEVRVRSLRVVGLLQGDATSETPSVTFRTECGEPTPPPLNVRSYAQEDGNFTVDISWEIGEMDYGCKSLSASTLKYKNTEDTDWTTIDDPYHIEDVLEADYIFNLQITNNDDFSAVTEKTVEASTLGSSAGRVSNLGAMLILITLTFWL